MSSKTKPDQRLNPDVEPYDQKKVTRRTFISSATFLAGSALAYWGWKKIYLAPNETPAAATAGARKPLRQVLDANEKVFNKSLQYGRLSPTYPKSRAAKKPRINGDIGLKANELENWKLKVKKSANEIMELELSDLQKLPKTQFAFEFKCVEGWSQVSHWGGVKFSDFVEHYKLQAQAQMGYVGLHTPDKKYYVGIDMASALHPQTLLCYEVNEQPLPLKHGAPLRLIIPTKYGIKNLKCIGTLFFSNERPPDYWAERGYDYFSGL